MYDCTMDDELKELLSEMQKDINQIKVDVGIIKDWRKRVMLYTHSVWMTLLATLGWLANKAFGGQQN